MWRSFLFFILIVLAAPVAAQDNSDWRFGGDAFMAGRNVTLSGSAVDDLFAAGDNVTARADVEGSAHMAGRYVSLDGRVGENFYGAGMEVDVAGPVAGDVTIVGDSLSISEPVSGDLRATGSTIDLTAPVAGNAILAGETVMVDAAITGDVALAAANIEWGDGARVEGILHIYDDDPSSVDVPERVAPADRVERHETEQWDGDVLGADRPSFAERLRDFLGAIVVIGVLGTILAAAAPGYVAGLRERALTAPMRTLWMGFLGLSAIAGSLFVLAMTGIGAILIPLSIIGSVLLGIAGYVVGTYVLGVWAVGVAGRGMPDTTGDRAIAAFAGAALAAVVALVPFVGWLFAVALALMGAGALVVRAFNPGFHVDRA